MLATRLSRKAVSIRLKQAREEAGYLSAELFCERHDISVALYLEQEAGKKPLKLSQALQYSDCFKVSVHWLLLGEEK